MTLLRSSVFRRSARNWLRAAALQSLRRARRTEVASTVDWASLRARFWRAAASIPAALAVPTCAVAIASIASAQALSIPAPSKQATLTLWEVEAAVMGFALALALFAYEVLPSEWAARRDLSLVAAFPASLNLGISVLLITGVAVVMTRPSDAAASMRAVAWLVSALWLLLLVFTFSKMATVRDPRARLAIRRRELSHATAKALDVQLVDRAAMYILTDRLEAAGGAFDAWISPQAADTEEHYHRAQRSGVVVDVDLRRLRRACITQRNRGAPLRLSIRLGQRVVAETLVARSDQALDPRVRADLRHTLVIEAKRA